MKQPTNDFAFNFQNDNNNKNNKNNNNDNDDNNNNKRNKREEEEREEEEGEEEEEEGVEMEGDGKWRPNDWKETVLHFCSITNMDEQLAKDMLNANNWNLERAVAVFFNDDPTTTTTTGAGGLPPLLPTPNSPSDPSFAHILSSLSDQPGKGQLIVYDQPEQQQRQHPHSAPTSPSPSPTGSPHRTTTTITTTTTTTSSVVNQQQLQRRSSFGHHECWSCGTETTTRAVDGTWLCWEHECWNKYNSFVASTPHTLLKIPDPRPSSNSSSFFSASQQQEQTIVTMKKPTPPEYFGVAQFNILAGALGTPEHFGYVKAESLKWEKRKEILLKQIKGLSSSGNMTILCVQELDNYWTFFQPTLEELGFRSVYVRRPSLHTSTWSGKEKHDGCGIFYKKELYELLEEKSVNFDDQHDRVALMILLREKRGGEGGGGGRGGGGGGRSGGYPRFLSSGPPGRLLIVVTTHLYWDSSEEEVQLKELGQLEEALMTFRKLMCHRWREMEIPVVVCGDFNNGPSSLIYRYMTHHFMRDQQLHMRSAYDIYQRLQQSSHKQSVESYERFWHNSNTLRRSGSVESEAIASSKFGGGSGMMEEGDDEDSAFLSQIVSGESEPCYTTFNYKRRWTIDFIFYSCNTLRATHLLEIPREDQVQCDEGPEGWVQRENQRRRKKRCTEQSHYSPAVSLDPSPATSSSSSSSPSTVALRRSGSVSQSSSSSAFPTEMGSGGKMEDRNELDENSNNNGIPNSKFGSDHLPILAVFQFKD